MEKTQMRLTKTFYYAPTSSRAPSIVNEEIFKSICQVNSEFKWSFFKHKKLFYNLRKGPIP